MTRIRWASVARLTLASWLLAILVMLPVSAHEPYLFELQVDGKTWSTSNPQVGHLTERSGQGLHTAIWSDQNSDTQILVIYPYGTEPPKPIGLGRNCRARLRCSGLALQGPQDVISGELTVHENDEFHLSLEVEGKLRDGRTCHCILWVSKNGSP